MILRGGVGGVIPGEQCETRNPGGLITGPPYEWTQHAPIAKQTGATDAQVAAIRQEAESLVFTDLEKQVLRFTDEITQRVRVSDATFQALAAHLSPRRLVELALATSFYGLAARMMEAFQVELEPTAGAYSLDQLRRGS
jgi:alkylhydroperoxidase family enzyme